MKFWKSIKLFTLFFVLSSLSFVLTGCTMRHYTVVKDRVDQDLTGGNRGYLYGNVPPQAQDENRPKTRKTHTLEVELANPLKIKQMPAVDETKEKSAESMAEPLVPMEADSEAALEPSVAGEEYVVQEGDTLQKISSKFYGTTKKWYKIYEVNKGVLKSPDRVYPGQKINIPKE